MAVTNLTEKQLTKLYKNAKDIIDHVHYTDFDRFIEINTLLTSKKFNKSDLSQLKSQYGLKDIYISWIERVYSDSKK